MISFTPLKVLMLKRHVTLKKLKQDTGLDSLNIRKLLTNKKGTRTVLIDKLCRYFNCKMTDICEYVPDENWDFEKGCRKDINSDDPTVEMNRILDAQSELQKRINDLKETLPDFIL
jgi:DNA-binding Xre family transcriptional regulator